MRIESRSNTIILFLQFLMFLGMTFVLVGDVVTDGIWILFPGLVGYVAMGRVIKIFINFYNSPEWMELDGEQLKIKIRFQESYSVNVHEPMKIAEASWVKFIASYDRKLMFPERKLTLYLGKAEFVGLNDFLQALKKANPNCEVDEFLL